MSKDFFGRKVVVVVFFDGKGNVLLQDRKKISKRGEDWGFFGGGIKEGESLEQAVKREIKEELNYEIKDYKYIGDCVNKLEDGYTIDRKVFIASIPKNINELKDSEGGEFKIFSIAETKKLKLVPGDEKVFEMIKKDRQRETIGVYQKLGKKYLQDIKNICPKAFFDFTKSLPKGAFVLDVGCAGGRDSKRLVNLGFKVIGIDLVSVFLDEAKKNVPEAKFIKMDLLKLDFLPNYFDAIWAYAVLLHIDKEDIPRVLKSLYKVLKPRGKIYIGLKEGQGVNAVKEKLTSGKERTFTYFSREEIKTFVKDAGFKIIYIKIAPDELKRKGVKWIVVSARK